MRNRRIVLMMLGTVTCAPRALFAQAKKSPLVIGWLGTGRADMTARNFAAFKDGLAALGWKEGQQYVIEARWADGQIERLPPLARDLAEKKPSVIVVTNRRAALDASNASQNIPIVTTGGNSVVAVGLAKSLARPGGMVTGVTAMSEELSTKYVELLLAAAPKVKRVGFLLDPASLSYTVFMKHSRSAVEHFRVEARFADVAKAEEIEPAIAQLAKEGVQGLVLSLSTGLFNAERGRILKLALVQRWPVVGYTSFAEDGGLVGYSAGNATLHRRAAWYVDRILKGTKPGVLPIEQPMVFETVVNLKTAKALGLTMPPEIMVRATRVIE